MKRATILGLFAAMFLASFAYADPCGLVDYTNVSTYAPTGPYNATTGTDSAWPALSYPSGADSAPPSSYGYFSNWSLAGGAASGGLNTYCQGVPYNSSDPTAARTAFLANGQSYLDTLNWNAASVYDCGNGNGIWCIDPASGNAQEGGGGANGTGYSFGGTPNGNPTAMQLTQVSSYGSMPNVLASQGGSDILTGDLTGGDLALTWDTSTTGATYSQTCANDDPNDPNGPGGYDPSCWTAGTNTGAAISGVGFDVQVGHGDAFPLGQWSITFAIYGETPYCTGSVNAVTGIPYENNAVIGGGQPDVVDCWDYQNGQMTSGGSDDVTNGDCQAGGVEPTADPVCSDYTDSTIQLLGTITATSDLNGDPVFVGFTTNDPFGVGAVVETGYSLPSQDSTDTNFGIDEVTLQTNPPAETPEPATLLLFGSGLLIAARRLRKQATK